MYPYDRSHLILNSFPVANSVSTKFPPVFSILSFGVKFSVFGGDFIYASSKSCVSFYSFSIELLKYTLLNLHTTALQGLAMAALLEFVLLFYLEVICSAW